MQIEEYISELRLINKQYGQEEDLYFIINKILRESLEEKNTVVIRDIHNMEMASANNFPGRRQFFCANQVPDFVILDTGFNQRIVGENNKVYGCVEIKKFIGNEIEVIDGIFSNLFEDKDNQPQLKILEKRKSYIDNSLEQTEVTYEFKSRKNNVIEDINKRIYEVLKELCGFNKVLLTDGFKWILYYIDQRQIESSQIKSECNGDGNYKIIEKLVNGNFTRIEIADFGKDILSRDGISDDDRNSWEDLLSNLKKIEWMD